MKKHEFENLQDQEFEKLNELQLEAASGGITKEEFKKRMDELMMNSKEKLSPDGKYVICRFCSARFENNLSGRYALSDHVHSVHVPKGNVKYNGFEKLLKK